MQKLEVFSDTYSYHDVISNGACVGTALKQKPTGTRQLAHSANTAYSLGESSFPAIMDIQHVNSGTANTQSQFDNLWDWATSEQVLNWSCTT